MEIKYNKEQIAEVLNIINTLPICQGNNFDTAFKISRIYQILNAPFEANKSKSNGHFVCNAPTETKDIKEENK